MGIGALRAVFLDRDGVVIRAVVRGGKPYPPGSVEEMEIVAEAPAALSALKEHGFLLLIVTNQPDVARKAQERAVVEGMHEVLGKALPIDGFYVCYHDDRDNCDCRKPKAGLLRRAASEYGLELSDCYLIGDRWRDIEAGQAAGCATVWIDCGYAEKGPKDPPSARVDSLSKAAGWILGQTRAE